MERGEVDGLCGFDWSSLQAQKSDWLRDKKLNILIQMASEEEPALTALGVPEIWGFLKSEDDRLAIQSRLADQTDLLQAVFASMSDGVSVANRQGQIIMVNPASTAMTGVTPTDRPDDEWAQRYGIYQLDGVTRLAEAKMPLYRALRG